MSVNSSPSSNDSPLFQNLTSYTSPPFILYIYCITSEPGSFIFITFTFTNTLLLLPLCIFILYHGLQQWHQKRSTSSAAALSHSDCFTYHTILMELIGVFGCFFSCCDIYARLPNFSLVGIIFQSLTWHGEIFFHTLTCAERYLAVVHPITYLSLRNERWIRIRNICVSCVWLICISGLHLLNTGSHGLIDFLFLIISATVISFCSVSVLSVLIRPGPGEQVGGRERVDQSKQRALYTILTILGAHVFKFAWSLVFSVMYMSEELSSVKCTILMCDVWFNLPASLVLPLLFLIRKGKSQCC